MTASASGPWFATPPLRRFRVETPDGVGIAAAEWGTPGGPELLFIHGFSQSGHCWDRQVSAPALAYCHMVTYDFRGHGASDRPLEEAAYKDPARWAGEVEAVRLAAGFTRPVLVGWSYAGRIIGDYLGAYGTGAISGIVFADAVTSNVREFFGSCNKLMRQMCSDDLIENVTATRQFIRRCFASELEPELFETLLGINMAVPPQVRAALFGRPAEYQALLEALDVPVLVTQGARDDVVAPAMARHIAASVPGAKLALFEEAGHAPFIEDADAFNAALAEFLALLPATGPRR